MGSLGGAPAEGWPVGVRGGVADGAAVSGPQPVNLFQNMSYPEGRVEFGESLAKPGDVVELRALMNVVAAVSVSACPIDLNPISGYRVTDIALAVLGARIPCRHTR